MSILAVQQRPFNNSPCEQKSMQVDCASQKKKKALTQHPWLEISYPVNGAKKRTYKKRKTKAHKSNHLGYLRLPSSPQFPHSLPELPDG